MPATALSTPTEEITTEIPGRIAPLPKKAAASPLPATADAAEGPLGTPPADCLGEALARIAAQSSCEKADQRAGKPPLVERRAFPRRESGLRVVVARLEAGKVNPGQLDWLLHASRLKGTILDISLNGISLMADVEFHVGERIALKTLDPARHDQPMLMADVLRAAPTDDNRWRVVCRLSKNLSFDEIDGIARRLSSRTV